MKNVWEVELLKREDWEASFDGKLSYVLPIASPEVLGGVQPIQKTEEMNQQVGVDKYGRLWFAKPDVESFTVIKPFPVHAKGQLRIPGPDIFQLEDETIYVWDAAAVGSSGALLAVADDGTVKTITALNTELYYVQVNTWNQSISIIGNNTRYIVSTADKSTADAITVTIQYNQKYLDIMTNKEFIPTLDYHPATKKYVDDAVKTVDVSEAVLITIEDIDAICGNIDENELPQSDIDELMNLLKEE